MPDLLVIMIRHAWYAWYQEVALQFVLQVPCKQRLSLTSRHDTIVKVLLQMRDC